MSEHARYGGSTYTRTLNCPPWAKFCDPLPERESSDYADVGTLLHIAMNRIYRADADFDARSLIGSTYKDQTLTAELYEEKIVPAIAAVEEIFERYDVAEDGFLCESRVVISELSWGTADLLATGQMLLPNEGDEHAEEKFARVGICLDYKFGDGIPVDAVENDQGRFYSAAAAITEETSRFFEGVDILVIGIIQPNDRGQDDFTLWETPSGELAATFQEAVAAEHRAEFCDLGDPSLFSTGDHCRFCAGNGLCPATSGALAAMRRLDVTAPDILKVIPTFAELAQVEVTIKKIRALVHSQLEEGVEIAGFKLVPKRANRSYTDEEIVRGIVKKSRKIKREDAYTDSLLTPAQLEIMCKRLGLDFEALFGAHVQKVSSGTTLADANDKRSSAPSIGALTALLQRD